MDNHNDLYRNTDLKTFANLAKKVFYKNHQFTY